MKDTSSQTDLLNTLLNPNKQRAGRGSLGVTLGLLLLGGLLLFPFYSWFATPAEHSDPVEYRLKPLADLEPTIKAWRHIDGLPGELAQFETVFWEPDDSASLRAWLRSSDAIAGASVLEVGTGTGLIALVCRTSKAESVVATDINPAAIACATYNADHLQIDQVEFRLVDPADPGPYSVIHEDERFDLIISNPPWEDAPVEEVAAYALYDPNFSLLDGLLRQSASHLRDGGSLLLAYGAKSAIQRILSEAPALGWTVSIQDDRQLEDLPEVFLPGMLLQLKRESTTGP